MDLNFLQRAVKLLGAKNLSVDTEFLGDAGQHLLRKVPKLFIVSSKSGHEAWSALQKDRGGNLDSAERPVTEVIA